MPRARIAPSIDLRLAAAGVLLPLWPRGGDGSIVLEVTNDEESTGVQSVTVSLRRRFFLA